jgi:hypothetical protein
MLSIFFVLCVYVGGRGAKQRLGQGSPGSVPEIYRTLDSKGLFRKLGNSGPIQCWRNGKEIIK